VVVVEDWDGEEDDEGSTAPLKVGMVVPFTLTMPPSGAVSGIVLGGWAALALAVKASRVLPWAGLFWSGAGSGGLYVS
jgi:hypothetical protein